MVRYCLHCGAPLASREIDGHRRPVCPACGWVYYPDPKVAVAVLVGRDGRIGGLKRFKEDVREVAGGYECGLSLEGFQDLKVGDVVEAYEVEEVARRLAAPAKAAQGAERSA